MYKYKDLELTPGVFKELLIKLFDGKRFKRSDAVKEIVDFHIRNKGICEKSEYISVFKKAVQQLKDSGINNCGYGVWELKYKEKEVVVYKVEKNVERMKADEEFGEGKYAVYVYFYDVYKELAEIKGEKDFPCKIGRTDRDPLQRIISQSGTCYPEKPHVALLFYCENSSDLENSFHSILKTRNKWMEDAPGVEWFKTNIEEIKEIYNFIKK